MDKAPDLEYQTCRREELTKAARDSLAEASLDTSRPSGFLFQNEEKLSLDKTTPGQQVLIIHALTLNPFSLEVFASELGEAAPSWKKVRNSSLHLTNIYRVVAVPTPILLSRSAQMATVNDIDDLPLTFGKYKGKTPQEVAEIDPGYIIWMHRTIFPAKCSVSLAIACEQDEQELEEDKIYHPEYWNE